VHYTWIVPKNKSVKKVKYFPKYLQDFLYQGFDFKSKTKTRPYFLSQIQLLASLLLGFLIYLLLTILESSLTSNETSEFTGIFVGKPLGIYLIYGLWCRIPNSVRRLRDAGFSPWWIFIYFVPFGGLALFVMHCQPSKK
jgi:uncharacterized membrane protein YhaH (DUF805 family)